MEMAWLELSPAFHKYGVAFWACLHKCVHNNESPCKVLWSKHFVLAYFAIYYQHWTSFSITNVFPDGNVKSRFWFWKKVFTLLCDFIIPLGVQNFKCADKQQITIVSLSLYRPAILVSEQKFFYGKKRNDPKTGKLMHNSSILSQPNPWFLFSLEVF